MNSQTPHKMLRTAFLRANRIRFPEGRRRLEDQLFITRAYFAASSASIVADYICYRYLRRADFGNAGSHRIDPADYYDNLREVLDVVEAHTEPGEFRDRCYRRFLRTEMLSRLGGRKLFNAPADHRLELLTEIRRLLAERFDDAVIAGLPAALRARAALVRSGTVDDVVAYAERMADLRPHTTLTRITRGRRRRGTGCRGGASLRRPTAPPRAIGPGLAPASCSGRRHGRRRRPDRRTGGTDAGRRGDQAPRTTRRMVSARLPHAGDRLRRSGGRRGWSAALARHGRPRSRPGRGRSAVAPRGTRPACSRRRVGHQPHGSIRCRPGGRGGERGRRPPR